MVQALFWGGSLTIFDLIFLRELFFDFASLSWVAILVFLIIGWMGPSVLLYVLTMPLRWSQKTLVIEISEMELSVRDEPSSDDSDFNKSIPIKSVKKIYYRRGICLFPKMAFVRTIQWVDQKERHHEFLDGFTMEGKISYEDMLKIFTFLEERKKTLGLAFEVLRTEAQLYYRYS